MYSSTRLQWKPSKLPNAQIYKGVQHPRIKLRPSAVLHLSRNNDGPVASQNLLKNLTKADQSDAKYDKEQQWSTQIENTDDKAGELDRTIQKLQKLNAELQAEMQQVVSGLTGVMETMQIATSASNATHLTNGAQSSLDTSSTPKTQDFGYPNGHKSSKAKDHSELSAFVHHHHTSSCVVQHPGAYCCTHIAAKADDITGTCSLTIKTVASRPTDDPDNASTALSSEDMAALAAQALLAAATEHFRSCTQVIHSHTHPAQRAAQHDQICEILQNGDILQAERNTPSQFGHPSFILHLGHTPSGRQLKAIFKPRVEGDAGGWHRAPMEYVAYRLNLLLGLDLVPPVAYRTTPVNFTIDGEDITCEEGAMMYYVEDADTLCNFPDSQWGVDKDLLLADTRVLDVLLHNSDRHHGHFLLGRHWCRGSWNAAGKWIGEQRPVLIDHAASFRKDAHVSLEHENAFQTGPVQCISAHTYLRLRFLDAAAVSQEFSSYLGDDEVVWLVQRRNYVLKCLDRLVERLGYQNVVKDAVSS